MRKRTPRSLASEEAFRKRVSERGGTCLYAEWLGSSGLHEIRCPQGHEVAIRPYTLGPSLNRGLCRKCTRVEPAEAEANFLARIAELGGQRAYASWQGVRVAHQVTCANGHECHVHPRHVQQGQGRLCRTCTGVTWDIFYVVLNPLSQQLKFGITSGKPSRRLQAHRADGFTSTLYLREDFPGAYALERAVKRHLKSVGLMPVRGTEYFSYAALPFVQGMLP